MMRKQQKLFILTIIISCLLLTSYILFQYGNSLPFVELETSRFSKRKEITDHNLIKQLHEILKNEPLSTDYRMSNRIIHINSLKESKKLYYFGASLFSLNEEGLYIVPEELSERLNSIFSSLEQEFYGEDMPWSEAKVLFSKNKDALVTDLETGLSFSIRRKSGTYHADVQPLTAKDTAVMKEIFGGSWSWKRRAIILTIDGKRIAASMNGMPHGAGSIKNNNFPGHFCIHFLGSKVHKSNKVDLAHQLMIAKASGKIFDEICTAAPEKLIAIFLTALKQHDWEMVSLVLGFKSSTEIDDVLEILKTCEDIKSYIINSNNGTEQNLLCTIPVTLTWKKKGDTAYKTTEILLTLKKSFLEGEWYIIASSLKRLE